MSKDSNKELFVRIVTADYYIAAPNPVIKDVCYSEFRSNTISQVPVIRIFGPTLNGVKVCVHVHGVFPYIFIPNSNGEILDRDLYQFASGLDKAINVSLGNGASNNQHVYKIVQVYGSPFYGYHSKEEKFLKVLFYNPVISKRAADLLQNGIMFNKMFQPHEAHIPFMLQFFIDNNLYGMSFIKLSSFRERLENNYSNNDSDVFNDEYVRPIVTKQSYSSMEVDVTVSDIMNVTEGSGKISNNPGLAFIFEEERKRCNMVGEKSASNITVNSLTPEFKSTSTEQYYLGKLKEKLEAVLSNSNENEQNNKCEELNRTFECDVSVVDEERILELTQKSVNSSFVELNSQGRDVFQLLQNLMKECEAHDANSTPDDIVQASQQYTTCEIDFSQPILKQSAENDSILDACVTFDDDSGDDLFKDDVNADTLVSTYKRQSNGFESSVREEQNIRDGDNALLRKLRTDEENGLSFESEAKQHTTKNEVQLNSMIESSAEKQSCKTTQCSSESVCSINDNRIDEQSSLLKTDTRSNRSKNTVYFPPKFIRSKRKKNESPKKVYPRLNIDVQKSPSKVSLKAPVACSSIPKDTAMIAEDYDSNDKTENTKFGNIEDVNLMSRKRKLNNHWNKYKIVSSLPKKIDDVSIKNNANNYDNDDDDDVISHTVCRENYNNSNNSNSNNNKGNCGDDGIAVSCIVRRMLKTTNNIWTPKMKAPTKQEVMSYLSDNGLPFVKNKQPFYDDPSDASVSKNICGRVIKIDSRSVKDLEEFKGFVPSALEETRYSIFQKSCNLSQIQPGTLNVTWLTSDRCVVVGPIKWPPSYKDATAWLKMKNVFANTESCKNARRHCPPIKQKLFVPRTSGGAYGGSDDEDEDDNAVSLVQSIVSVTTNADEQSSSEKDSQDKIITARDRLQNVTSDSSRGAASPSFLIDCATPDNSYGFALTSENLQDVKDEIHYQYITGMSLEVFVQTRSKLNPDPEYDSINAIFYSVINDIPNECHLNSGIILVGRETDPLNSSLKNFRAKFMYVDNEEQLLNHFISIVRQYDPDMLIGYEVEMLSWGYLIHRGKFLGKHFDLELSRVKKGTHTAREKLFSVTEFKFEEAEMIGRIILNVWRLLRHEVTLQSYTFENIMNHVLHQRVPHHSFESLTMWWFDPLHRWVVIDYYLLRVECTLQILQHLDFIGRTSELARLFGIQFYEVLSRGSQFRVESMMLRMAKPQNYVAASPSIQQRSKMRAPETVPLIMEPESRYYTDPVIVLDFQSLYPSMIIAYNYCFSTCLGRVEHLGKMEPYEFGCLKHFISPCELKRIQDNLHVSPCGVTFVNKSIRTGILPAMLEEILKARLLVKKSMKKNQGNKMLQRVLHARQLGLKLIANVTYGYTAANFSGRMPCIEVGDSVVSKGRETLERAIELISENENWKARVIYGDTDSLFVLVPGRSKEEAFRIGKEMADTVTRDNPKPVKLKFEKVYQPCILQTKKRYVGYMYETPEQSDPVYDAKGIETVRRDGCPAVSKILEKSLKLLFDTCNISLVKRFVQRQFEKLISGHVSIQDLTFAREYRGRSGYRPTACVPALKIAKEAIIQDRRSEPRVKERVRYVIVAGHSGMSLINLVRTPQQIFQNPDLRFNAEYYITRVIVPPLDRCFSLLAVNVLCWYTELPRKHSLYLPNARHNQDSKKGGTISQYFYASSCLVCHKIAVSGLCEKCVKKPQVTIIVLANKINTWQRKINYIEKVCQSCCGNSFQCDSCVNLDCAVLYRKLQSKRDAEQVPYLQQLQNDHFF